MSPKTKKQNDAIRQQSIEAIKQAALSLFAHKGYANTSISAIAKSANVSKGLMYNYFESKEKLLEEIINDAALVGTELMENVVNKNLAPKSRLKLLINGTFDWVLSHFEYYKLIASLGFQEDVLVTIKDFIKQKAFGHLQLGESLFQEMGHENPRIMAYEFGAILDGIFVHLMHLEDDYPIEEMKEFLLKKYELTEE